MAADRLALAAVWVVVIAQVAHTLFVVGLVGGVAFGFSVLR